MNIERFSKFCLSLGFLTLCGILYMIYTTPNATGYEITIYNAFPKFFFFLFIIVYLLGYSVIFGLLKRDHENKMYFVFAFLLIFITNAILLSLCNLHGYLLYGRGEGDVLYHIGAMKDIILYGHIFEANFYPIVHIIGAILQEITLISFEKITTLLRITFFLCFPLSLFFLSGSMFKEYWKRILITSFGTLLVFSVFSMTFHPSVLSTTMIPFVLGSYQYRTWSRKNNISYTILLLILIFSITFMHPMTTIFLLLIFLLYSILANIFNHSNMPKTNSLTLIMITLTAFLTWYLSFYTIQHFIKKIYLSYVAESETSIAVYYMDIYSTIDLSIYQTLKYLLWSYGHLVILFGIGILYISINILKYLKKEKISEIDIIYSSFQLIGIIIAVIFMTGFFIEFEVVRVSRLGILFAVISCGLLSIYLIDLDKKYLIIPLILLLALSSFFVFNVYSSERQSLPNYQLTKMEYLGLDWIINHRNESIAFLSNTNIMKNQYYILGHKESYKHHMVSIRGKIPNNFGYAAYNTLGDAVESELDFDKQFYTTYTKYMEINYNVLPEEVWDIATKYDKKIVNNDVSINCIYSNGEHENWLVSSKK